MSVKGRTVRHCRGKDKGKVVKKHRTKADALAQHRAIMAGKRKKGK